MAWRGVSRWHFPGLGSGTGSSQGSGLGKSQLRDFPLTAFSGCIIRRAESQPQGSADKQLPKKLNVNKLRTASTENPRLHTSSTWPGAALFSDPHGGGGGAGADAKSHGRALHLPSDPGSKRVWNHAAESCPFCSIAASPLRWLHMYTLKSYPIIINKLKG